MASDEERLVVSLEARINDFERKMQRAERTGARSYQQLTAGSSRATRQMEQDMVRATNRINQALASTSTSIGAFGKAFGAGFGGLAGVLSVREVIRFADAWTSAKNSLAVAGVVGANQVKVLDQLYQSAQRNAAPVEALADLFGKAAQASDNLGASQADLLKFSGGVATALRVAGTSATAASGALTQLGQLLGSARVQAEEFNSVNEGARPILIAVAKGLDAAGGSVSKLKALVNDGKVSSQDFFNAFLKGLPAIEAMAGNATQTIDQSWTKVNNALTRYIGQTDSSLGASQRLVQGLNALADNFDETADRALQLASVVAGALVGRSLFGMISTLGKGTKALIAFGRALAAARTAGGLAAAFGGLGAVAGPVGLLIGGTVVTALTAFSSSSSEATGAAKTYADALELVRNKAAGAAGEIEKTTAAIDEKTANALSGGVDEGTAKIDEARTAVLDLFRQILDNAPRRLISEDQLSSLEELRSSLENGKASADQVNQALYGLANTDPKFKQMADQLNPLLEKLGEAIAAVGLLQDKLSAAGRSSGPSFRDTENASMDAYQKMVEQADRFIKEQGRRASLTRDQLRLETEITKVRSDSLKEGVTLTEKQIEQTARANIEGEKARSAETKTRSRKASDYDTITRSIREHISAMQAEAQSLGLSGAAATAFRVEQELLNDALSRGVNVTPQIGENFKKLAMEAGEAEQALSALKLSQDLLFERQQIGRSQTDQRVYSELRSANIDIASQSGQRLANEIRMVENLKEQKGVIEEIGDVLADIFTQPLREGEKFFDRIIDGFASIGRSFAQKGFDTLLKQMGVTGAPVQAPSAPALSIPKVSAVQTGKQIGETLAPAVRNSFKTAGDDMGSVIRSAASAIGTTARDLATVISYETSGTFSTSIRGGAGNRHIGLIQFGPQEQLKYGAAIGQTFRQQMDAVVRYVVDRGFKPGMSLKDLYSTINAGRPGLYNRSDAANGGAPGTVADKVDFQMGAHRATGDRILNRQVVADGVVDANKRLSGGSSNAPSGTGAAGAAASQLGSLQNLFSVGGAALGAFSNGYQSGSPVMGGISGAMAGVGAAPALAALGMGAMATPIGLIGGAIVGPLGGTMGKARKGKPA